MEEILKHICAYSSFGNQVCNNLGQLLIIVPNLNRYIFKPIKFVQLVQLEPIHPEPTCAIMVIDHRMIVIQIQVGKNFIDDVLIDGGSRINIIVENLILQLSMSKLSPTPYNLFMADQAIAKPLDLIKNTKIFVHGIPCTITFIVINNNVLDSSYSMLLGCPWLKDAKISHNWGTNTITIQGTSIMRTIHVTKKLGVQTKRPKVLICYDFHHGISNEKEDVMFATKLDLFSIGTILVPIHTKLVSTPNYNPNFRIT